LALGAKKKLATMLCNLLQGASRFLTNHQSANLILTKTEHTKT